MTSKIIFFEDWFSNIFSSAIAGIWTKLVFNLYIQKIRGWGLWHFPGCDLENYLFRDPGSNYFPLVLGPWDERNFWPWDSKLHSRVNIQNHPANIYIYFLAWLRFFSFFSLILKYDSHTCEQCSSAGDQLEPTVKVKRPQRWQQWPQCFQGCAHCRRRCLPGCSRWGLLVRQTTQTWRIHCRWRTIRRTTLRANCHAILFRRFWIWYVNSRCILLFFQVAVVFRGSTQYNYKILFNTTHINVSCACAAVPTVAAYISRWVIILSACVYIFCFICKRICVVTIASKEMRYMKAYFDMKKFNCQLRVDRVGIHARCTQTLTTAAASRLTISKRCRKRCLHRHVCVFVWVCVCVCVASHVTSKDDTAVN